LSDRVDDGPHLMPDPRAETRARPTVKQSWSPLVTNEAEVRDPRLTHATVRVLQCLLENPTSPIYGLQILQSAGLAGGTLYPILARLEHAGWVESFWEEIDPTEAGRPRRRYYQFTPTGAAAARTAVAAYLQTGPARRLRLDGGAL
jgi:PadR family transcriptional regulator PadR